jgi:hypothetical protein
MRQASFIAQPAKKPDEVRQQGGEAIHGVALVDRSICLLNKIIIGRSFNVTRLSLARSLYDTSAL